MIPVYYNAVQKLHDIQNPSERGMYISVLKHNNFNTMMLRGFVTVSDHRSHKERMLKSCINSCASAYPFPQWTQSREAYESCWALNSWAHHCRYVTSLFWCRGIRISSFDDVTFYCSTNSQYETSCQREKWSHMKAYLLQCIKLNSALIYLSLKNPGT